MIPSTSFYIEIVLTPGVDDEILQAASELATLAELAATSLDVREIQSCAIRKVADARRR